RDLMNSVKERAEHLMLVDLGRNDIGRVAKPGSVNVKNFMHVQRFSHVMHLVSFVEGRLDRKLSPWDALASCFPAGTLSGAPKIRAMEIIAGLEPVRRNAYGGAVVYYDFAGQLDSCITIRSLYVQGKHGYAQAGAGIVADSRPEMEYLEVLHKLKAVRRAVAMANEASNPDVAPRSSK
ncbi:MAG: anthranilate synthase component I family protein, partial [Deltaproteobacteria bacterium]|nr:anthranilate synthase component I family protein [Deltaproteobacteria bacterium]